MYCALFFVICLTRLKANDMSKGKVKGMIFQQLLKGGSAMYEKIVVKDGRGTRMIKVGKKNREIVRQWFLAHPGGTQVECFRSTGLTRPTISKHLRAILKVQPE